MKGRKKKDGRTNGREERRERGKGRGSTI